MEITLDQLFEAMEKASQQFDESLDRVTRGKEWIATHSQTHPQYPAAAALLEQRIAESDAAGRELEAAITAFNGVSFKAAPETQRKPSLNCVVCGKPVQGYPPPKPGYYVHISCSMEENDVK